MFEILEKLPELLNHEKVTNEHWDIILTFHSSHVLLQLLADYQWLLNHDKMTIEFLGKILASDNSITILDTLNEYPDLIIKLTPELLDKILSSWNPVKILRTLGKHPELLNHEKVAAELLGEIQFDFPLKKIIENAQKSLEFFKDLILNFF